MSDSPFRVVLSSVGSAEQAAAIARAIIDRELAACCNILPGVRSIYRWKNELRDEAEVLMIFKTTEAAIPALSEAIRELHPYDVPEFVVLPVDVTSSDYGNWIAESVHP